jgi:predicted permease
MELRQNLRFALRTLRRSPGFTAMAVLPLGLGIGLAAAVFTIAEAVLARPLPVRDQDRLVVLWGITEDGRTDHFPLLYRDAREFARTTNALERVEFFSFGGAQPVAMRVGDGIVRLRRSLVSGGYFDLLGTRPLMGRTLRPEDDAQGAAPVAVLSYAGWQRFFGGDVGIVGRRIAVHADGTAYTIVGVMPRGLDYPQAVDLWSAVVPNSRPLGDQPIYAELNVIGRLRSGATIASARDELTRHFASHAGAGWRVRGVAQLLSRDILGDVRPAVFAFTIAAGLLLFITCVNVANLLIVRGVARVRELAVRLALGAGRRRLVAQIVTESALLAVGGGLLGALFAVAAIRAFVLFAPDGMPRLDEIRIGGPILLGATAITALALPLFALAPALLSARVDSQEAFRSGARQSGPGRRIRGATHALVVGQVTLAVLVLSAAGLVARSFVALRRVEVVVDPARLLVAELSLPPVYLGNAQWCRALPRCLAFVRWRRRSHPRS